MESCAFTYDGGADLSVTITNAVIGVTYRIRCSDTDSSVVSAAAVTSTLILNVTDVGGDPAGYRFRARVDRTDNNSFVGCTGFAEGTAGEYAAAATWATDGANPPKVTLTFKSENGRNYFLGINSNGFFITDTTFTGDGTLMTVDVTSGTGTTFGYLGQLGDNDTGEDLINRMFVAGAADDGFPGNPVIPPLIALPATSVTQSSARLNGTANPWGIGIFAWFEYGLTLSYGSETAHVYMGDGGDPVDLSAVVSGLSPGRTYHYRVAADTGSPPPPGTFGYDLPARLPESTGTTRTAASDAQLVTAFAASAPGDIVDITADIDGGGVSRTLSKSGTSGAPILLTSSTGKKIHNYHEFVISGQYVRVRGLEITGNGAFGTTDGIKIDGQFIEVDGCYVHDNIGSGIQVGSTSANLQVWNCVITRNGSNANLDHGIYWSHSGGNCVLANCLIYDNWAYNVQAYSNTPNLIVTCCTIDGGESHADERGGVVAGDSPQTHDQNYYGCIVTNAPSAAGWHYNGSTTVSNYVWDAIAYNNAGGNFGSGFTYTNCSAANPLYVNAGTGDFHLQAGSPAIGKIDPSRYGFVPETDIDGNPRLTADCGCYAA